MSDRKPPTLDYRQPGREQRWTQERWELFDVITLSLVFVVPAAIIAFVGLFLLE